MLRRFFTFVYLVPRNLAVIFLLMYRKIVSPLYGEVCRYYPSCSKYALQSFQSRGLFLGALYSAWRVLRCNPWSAGGIDDPKQLNNSKLRLNKYGIVVPADLNLNQPED